ncbi:MAG: hypothetical protein KDK35_12800 [Leptospiraceae bacterium]|nr:hypothetical protein [Leptospiraceae bacterium]
MRATYGGDALRGPLALPLPVWLYRPAYSGADSGRILEPARKGIPDSQIEARSSRATLTAVRTRARHALLSIEPGPDATAVGLWVCLERAAIEAAAGSDGLFFFQIRGLPVATATGAESIGHVIDFLDTGADGVLLIRCLDDCEVMVPMVDEFVTVDLKAGFVFVPQLDEFRV